MTRRVYRNRGHRVVLNKFHTHNASSVQYETQRKPQHKHFRFCLQGQ